MHKRWAAIVVVVLAFSWTSRATSQDNYEERISDLETRVAVLEGDEPAPEESEGDREIRGVVVFSGIAGAEVAGNRDTCEGARDTDFEDIGFGGDVIVLDGDDNEIGRGEFEVGSARELDAVMVECTVPFEVDGLPEVDRYLILFGAEDWYADYTFEQLEDADWRVTISQ